MRAIDVHSHQSTKEFNTCLGPFMEATAKYYGYKPELKTDEQMAEDFRKMDVKAIMVGFDAETNLGTPPVSNDYIASLCKRFPDAIIAGFGSVDPWKGKVAVEEAERAIKELGLLGLKFQQTAMAFFPNDRRFYPIYEVCQSLGAAVQFHTGTTGLGAGLPGALGVHLKYTQPIPYIDDVAADFPNLTIIGSHPSWPWQDEMIAVVLHKGNVFMELSGWSPKYFPEALKREVNGRLQDKVMFGSDYPIISPKRWLDDFEQSGYKAEVIEKVFYKNAQRILRLEV